MSDTTCFITSLNLDSVMCVSVNMHTFFSFPQNKKIQELKQYKVSEQFGA